MKRELYNEETRRWLCEIEMNRRDKRVRSRAVPDES